MATQQNIQPKGDYHGYRFFSIEEISYEHTLNEKGPGDNNIDGGSTCGKCGGCGQCGKNCGQYIQSE